MVIRKKHTLSAKSCGVKYQIGIRLIKKLYKTVTLPLKYLEIIFERTPTENPIKSN
jgi:hypothetical protein